MEHGGRRFIIDLHTQTVGEEAALLDFEGEDGGDDKGKKRMEPDEEGVLRLEEGLNEDDLDLLNNLFHWQMEDYELFLSCNMLRVDKKGEKNECPKEYREVEEGKAIMTEAKGNKRKDSIVWYTGNKLCGKKRLHHTTKLVERCRQQRKHIVRFAQETRRKGLIKTSVVRSEGSKIKNTVIDGKEWQPTEFMIPSVENKLGDMKNLRERSCNLNKLDE